MRERKREEDTETPHDGGKKKRRLKESLEEEGSSVSDGDGRRGG